MSSLVDALLRQVAEALADLPWKAVFVGGSTTHLHLTDPAAPEPELTDDVDVVLELYSVTQYQIDLREHLRALGAKEDTSEDAPLCRWLIGGVKVDIMTPDAQVLGFSNRWYPLALETAVQYALSAERSIFLAHPVAFIATKMEAFLGRGKDDLLASKDVEDVIAVIDGRPELPAEVAAFDPGARNFIRSEAARWLGHRDLPVAIEGYLRGEVERTRIVFERLNELAAGETAPDRQ